MSTNNKLSLTEEVSQNIVDEFVNKITRTVWMQDADVLEMKKVLLNVCRVNLAAVLDETEE